MNWVDPYSWYGLCPWWPLVVPIGTSTILDRWFLIEEERFLAVVDIWVLEQKKYTRNHFLSIILCDGFCLYFDIRISSLTYSSGLLFVYLCPPSLMLTLRVSTISQSSWNALCLLNSNFFYKLNSPKYFSLFWICIVFLLRTKNFRQTVNFPR